MDTKPFHHALVADDGRSGGDAALSAAPFVLDHLAGAMTVAHAVEIPAARDVAGPPQQVLEYRVALERNAQEWLEKRVAMQLGDAAHDVHRAVGLGNAGRFVRRVAEDADADLIMVGPHHKEHLLDFGGTQRAVFAGTGCHIWSQPFPFKAIRRVLAPCDLSKRSMRALGYARDVARALGVNLKVLHASPPPAFADVGVMYGDVAAPSYVVDSIHEAARKRFDETISKVNFEGVTTVEHEFAVGDPVHTIEDARVSTDLVVMGTRGYTGLSAVIFGGTAYAVLRAGNSAVLAIDA